MIIEILLLIKRSCFHDLSILLNVLCVVYTCLT